MRVADGTTFLLDLAMVTGVAALTTLVFHRLRQPVVMGYLLAGVLIGPHGPLAPFTSGESVRTLAELGIVFLMFSIGLEFRLQRLGRAGFAAVGAALLGILVVGWSTTLVGQLVGWSAGDARFMGAILAISSTVIAAKAIVERREQSSRWAELAMGILLVQDVAALAILAVLGTSAQGGLGVAGVLGVLGRLATFAFAALVLGLLFVPRVVNHLARRGADEVLVVTLVGLALGVAVLAVLLGFDPALGAFLIGAVVAESSEAWSAEQRVLPLRDLFTAVFFVSVGMLIDPALLAQNWQAAVALAALMLGLKVGIHSIAAFLLGAAPRDAFRASLAVGQIGEFSFVIAALGLSLGVVSGFVLPVTVAIAAAGALWTPYLVRAADALYDRLARRAPLAVVTSTRLYHGWVAHRTAQAGRLDPQARARARQVVLNAGAALLVLLATGAAAEWVRGAVTVRGLTDRALALLPWVAGGVLAVPFAVNAARPAWALLHGAGRTLASGPTQGVEGRARHALHIAVALLAVGGLAAAVVLVVSPHLPPFPLLLLTIAAFLGAAVVLWESMVTLHRRVEETLQGALGGRAQGEDRRAALEALRSEFRWGMDLESLRVHGGTRGSGITVQRLDLRARTGATLVAVVRSGSTVVNPAADFALQAGDNVVLLGEPEQLERARLLLEAPAARPGETGAEVQVARLLVEAGSALAGVTLAEARFRERTGATIVGVVRGGERLPNPGGSTRLQAEDVLLVVGAAEHVREAEAMARGPGDGAPGRPGRAEPAS